MELLFFAGGVVNGLPKEPYFIIAEIITMISAVVLTIMMAAIHICTSSRFFSLLALGWMFITAGITITVHFAELTVARQLDPDAKITFARFYEFIWPSFLYGIAAIMMVSTTALIIVMISAKMK